MSNVKTESDYAINRSAGYATPRKMKLTKAPDGTPRVKVPVFYNEVEALAKATSMVRRGGVDIQLRPFRTTTGNYGCEGEGVVQLVERGQKVYAYGGKDEADLPVIVRLFAPSNVQESDCSGDIPKGWE